MGLCIFCSSTCMDFFCKSCPAMASDLDLPCRPWQSLFHARCRSGSLGAAVVAGSPGVVVPASHAGHFTRRWQEMMTEGAFFMHFVGDQSINTARGIEPLTSDCFAHTAFISPVTITAQCWVNHELLAPLSIVTWVNQRISTPSLTLPLLSLVSACVQERFCHAGPALIMQYESKKVHEGTEKLKEMWERRT